MFHCLHPYVLYQLRPSKGFLGVCGQVVSKPISGVYSFHILKKPELAHHVLRGGVDGMAHTSVVLGELSEDPTWQLDTSVVTADKGE